MAFLTVGLCPVTTMLRTAHVGYVRAWAVHFVSAVVASLLIVACMIWPAFSSKEVEFWFIVSLIEQVLAEVADEFRHAPLLTTLIIGSSVLGVELAVVVAAMLFAPWGARDESILSSLCHALRRTWLYTAHAPLLILLCGLALMPLWGIESEWRQASRLEWNPPPVPPLNSQNQPKDSPARKEYEQALAEFNVALEAHHDAWQMRYSQRPWLVKYADLLGTGLVLLACAWSLWAWLRSVGAPRREKPPDRPPLCEFCGYNLTGTALASRCPECGEPVSASLGPDARPGPPWQHRAEIGRWRAWWRCTLDALLHRREFGRTLRAYTPTSAHRTLLAINLIMVFVVAWIGVMAVLFVENDWSWPPRNPDAVWYVGLFLGITSAVLALAVTFLAAISVGIGYHVADRRNLMPVTMQASLYLGVYLAIWTALVFAMIAVAVGGERLIRELPLQQRTWVEVGAVCLVLLMNMLLLFGYIRRVIGITAGARYANR
ncbi:MAG: hypothetical protein GY842_28560 [bacterium]|nr:hypothetical protein [bacterium]